MAEQTQETQNDMRVGIRWDGDLVELDGEIRPSMTEIARVARFFGASWEDLLPEETTLAIAWLCLLRSGKKVTLEQVGAQSAEALEEIEGSDPPTGTPEDSGTQASLKPSGSGRGKSKT